VLPVAGRIDEFTLPVLRECLFKNMSMGMIGPTT